MDLPHGTQGRMEGPEETGLPGIITGLLLLTPPTPAARASAQRAAYTVSSHPKKLLRGRCDSPRVEMRRPGSNHEG